MTLVRGVIPALAVIVITFMGTTGRQAQPPEVYGETLYAFGTLVEILIADTPQQTARSAIAALDQGFQQRHRDWHGWRKGPLDSLNTAIAAGQPYDVGHELSAVLQHGQALSAASNGLFDPGIGALIALWGFHADTPPSGTPPTPQKIAKTMKTAPSIADLRFDGTVVTSSNPHVQLDLGGYAKGSALAWAAQTLQRRGIANAVLNAGGDVVVLGTRGDRSWRLAIRDPFAWGAVAALDVFPGEAVFTSGNYERFLDHNGQRFSHILDPRTGWPVQGLVSATVVHRDPAVADAAATALSVAGPEGWDHTARAMGIVQALLIDDTGQLWATPAMARRLHMLPRADTSTPWSAPTIVTLGES